MSKDELNESPDQKAPVKSSFSIDRRKRAAIRRTSNYYGVTQGEVVEISSALFSLAAERSLRNREAALPEIRRLVREVGQGLERIVKLAPHLGLAVSWGRRYTDGIPQLEEESIKSRSIHGLSEELVKRSEFFGMTDHDSFYERDPLFDTIQEMASEIDSSTVTHLFRGEEDAPGNYDFRVCETEEDKQVRERVNEEFTAGLAIDGLISEQQAVKLAEPLLDLKDASDPGEGK